jgi:adenosylcobinamide-GDP ribazoletransferase
VSSAAQFPKPPARAAGGLAAGVRRQLVLLILAIGFLTRLPMPAIRGFEPAWLARAAVYFPLVGVLVGVIHGLVWRASALVLPNALAVGFAMGASLLVTGAFHEDGFADVCDGLGGAPSRGRALEIMKDSRIGAFGAMGIFMMLALKWTALASMPLRAMVPVVIAAHMVSRLGACCLIASLRYVREGESKSKPVAEGLGVVELLGAGLLGAAALLTAMAALNAWPAPSEWRMLGMGCAAAAVATLLCALYFKHRLGGYTGDCLGATQQSSELAFLAASLAAVGTGGAVGVG